MSTTPAPWYVGAQNDSLFIVAGRAPSPDNDYPFHGADRTAIAKVYDEHRDDARLIAAAPDLLEALKASAATFCSKDCPGGWTLKTKTGHTNQCVANYAAIAKAEGRS